MHFCQKIRAISNASFACCYLQTKFLSSHNAVVIISIQAKLPPRMARYCVVPESSLIIIPREPHTLITLNPPPLLPHLSVLLKPLPTSRPQTTPSSPTALPASNLPTSLPIAYPAEKLIALNSTTTPAPTAQVKRVGCTSALAGLVVRRCFLDLFRSLELLALRLPFSELDREVAEARWRIV